MLLILPRLEELEFEGWYYEPQGDPWTDDFYSYLIRSSQRARDLESRGEKAPLAVSSLRRSLSNSRVTAISFEFGIVHESRYHPWSLNVEKSRFCRRRMSKRENLHKDVTYFATPIPPTEPSSDSKNEGAFTWDHLLNTVSVPAAVASS